MAYVSLTLPPGVYRNGTQYQSKGRWWDANLTRFQEGQIKPIGGWQVRSSGAAAFSGKARAIISWRTNGGTRWIAIGTHKKLYVQSEVGANSDITPIRKTTSPLGSNPLTTTNGQHSFTVHDAAHGASAGETVILSGATAFNGMATGDLDATFDITSITDANNYVVTSTGTASASSAGGGAAVVAAYQIHPGRADGSQNLGYGGNAYGYGFYGAPRPNTSAYLAVTVWTLDTWGEDLIGCADTDGKIYKWTLDATAPAAVLPEAPTGNQSIVVTPEFFIFALGAGGDVRKVQWCDQQDDSNWTPDATNQAGDYDLTTAGTLQCGRAMRGVTLLLTDVDAWAATYVGTPLVYGFQRVGSGCGIVAKGAIAARDTEAAWMGNGGFWLFDGQSVQPLDCEVQDHVFTDINANQISKTTAVHNTAYGEMWWFYPSGASIEIDRYVVWAYRESQRLGRNVWTIGALSRTAGTGRGVFPNPLMVDADGQLFEHETGWNYDGAVPYLETGPQELGLGDHLAEIQRIIPDEATPGQVKVTFYGRLWPEGDETTYGPYVLASPTDVLFQAREMRVRFTGVVLADWRVGDFRLDIVQGDPI